MCPEGNKCILSNRTKHLLHLHPFELLMSFTINIFTRAVSVISLKLHPYHLDQVLGLDDFPEDIKDKNVIH